MTTTISRSSSGDVALPSPADLRKAVGYVAHVFSTPLPHVWEMELADLAVWAGEAVELYKALYGGARRR